MKITLVMVQSVDGKTTKWQDAAIHGWSSSEDRVSFRTLKATHTLLVMGRKTYEHVRSTIQLTPQTRHVVLTKLPLDFSGDAVTDQLEFTDESPKVLVSRLERMGYTSMLLVGGSETNEAFLKEKLITDCFVTIEPRFFGKGKSVFTAEEIDIPLNLTEMTKLNMQGTLLLHYTVLYEH